MFNLVYNKYESNNNFNTYLEKIWYTIPIKKEKKGGYSGVSRYLDLIDDIFSNKNLDYNFLINQFTEVIRIIKFEQYLRHLVSRNKMNSEMHHTEFHVQHFLIFELFK